MAQKRDANTGQSQHSTLTCLAFITIILEDQHSALGLFTVHSKPCVSTLTLHPPIPVSSTSRDIPSPRAYNKPQTKPGSTCLFLSVPCQHTNGLAHSLPARLTQMKMVPKLQPISDHVTSFQKKEQYLGYCSAKNLNQPHIVCTTLVTKLYASGPYVGLWSSSGIKAQNLKLSRW